MLSIVALVLTVTCAGLERHQKELPLERPWVQRSRKSMHGVRVVAGSAVPVALGTSRKSGHRTCRGSKNSLLNAEHPNERRTRSAHEGVSASVRVGLGEGQRPPLWGWGPLCADPRTKQCDNHLP